MAKRITIPLDNTPIIKLNEELKALSERYQMLNKENQALTRAVEKGAKDQTKALEENKKALTDVGAEITAITKGAGQLNKAQPFEKMAQATIPLRQQLKLVEDEMQLLALSGDFTSEKFVELGNKAGEIKRAIGATADQMVQFERAGESAINGLSLSFGNLSRNLLSMDFGAAEEGVLGINQAIKSVDIQQTGKDFLSLSKTIGTTLVSGLKTVGSTFLAVGKIILSNPLFLIASIVIAVISAIVALSDKFEILGDIVDALKAPFIWLANMFSKLTDWLGITNNAEQELANDRADRAKEEEARVTKESTLKQNQFNRDIALLQAKGDLTDEEKEQIQSLTIASLRAEEERGRAQLDSVKAQIRALKVKGDLTDEEKTQLAELRQSYIDLGETIKDTQNNIEVSKIAHEADLSAIEKQGIADREAKQAEAWNKRKAEIERQRQEEAKLREDAIKFIADIEEKARIEALEDDNLRSLEVTLTALQKERDEILKNTQLTEDEKTKIKEYYNALNAKANKDYNDAVIADEKQFNDVSEDLFSKFEEQKLNDKLQSLQEDSEQSLNAMLAYKEEAHTQEMEANKKDFEELLAQYEKQGLDTNDLTNFYLDKQKEDTLKYNEQIAEIRQADIDKQQEQERQKWSDTNQLIADSLAFQGDLYSQLLAETSGVILGAFASINEVLDDESATVSDKVVAVVEGVLGMISSILSSISQVNKQLLDDQLSAIEQSSNAELAILDNKLAQGLISQEEADAQKYKFELDKFNKEEKLKKEQFESDKKLQIAQASIAMIQGMVTAFTGAMQLGPIAGPIVGGILAAAVGVMGGLNIAKIKKTKYNGGTPPSPSASIPSASIPNENNSVSLDGQTASGMSSEVTQSPAQNITPPVEVSVSIGEIEDVSKRVNKYETASEL